jgi:hypothetical protein
LKKSLLLKSDPPHINLLLDPGASAWKTVCDRCATDSDDPWIDPHPTLFGASYCVTASNADGVPSLPTPAR